MKKTISTIIILSILAVAMLGTASANSETMPFSDVPEAHWAFTYVVQLQEAGIVDGYEDGTYRPRGELTRAEWSKLLAESAGLSADPEAEEEYADLINPDAWFYDYAYAVIGLLDDYTADGDLIFRPNEPASREDVAVSLAKLLGAELPEPDASTLDMFTDRLDISEANRDYVAIAVEMQLFDGYEDNTFRPNGVLNRAEAAALLWRAFIDEPGSTEPVVNPLSVGEIVTAVHEQTASTGYVWEFVISDTDIIEFDTEYVLEEPSEPGLTGAPSVLAWNFKGVSPGTATITFRLIRPWEPDEAAEEVVYRITVIAAEE